MQEKIVEFGKKSEEYPYGYGFCQCGCGRRTISLSNGAHLRFFANHKERHKERIYIKSKIGTIVKKYKKGWGLCQCGCGKETIIRLRIINGRRIIVANRYYKFHYAKTKESREKQSIIGARVLKKRSYSPFTNYGRSEHGLYFSKKLGYEIGYMSTYEKLAFEIIDNDPSVENYIPQPFGIEYNYRGTQRTYIPDILIYYKDSRRVIIEVKPKLQLEKPMNKAKFEALESFCKQKNFDFEIWYEDVLKTKSEKIRG